MPRIIPVIDLLHGQVVRAVGGQRKDYRPVVSTLTTSTDAIEIAQALMRAANSREIYIADLDAIMGDGTPSAIVNQMASTLDATVWLDCGVRHGLQVRHLVPNARVRLILATETGINTEVNWPVDRYAISIDLQDGRILGDWKRYDNTNTDRDVLGLLSNMDDMGCPYIILDLIPVGRRGGLNTLGLCRAVKSQFPWMTLWTGGGIASQDDLKLADDAGVDAVLVSTALHEGTLQFNR